MDNAKVSVVSVGVKAQGNFSRGILKYAPGEVTLSFHSNTDDRHFSVIQRASNWDSQTLRDDFVANSGHAYHTLQAGGRTIYAFSQGNATWVNGGIWYQIIDNADLSTSQLLNLATSM